MVAIFVFNVVLLIAVAFCDQSIEFSGYKFIVKEAADEAAVAPGPNYWSSEQVFVDKDGFLHLNSWYDDVSSRWKCSEISSKNHFGYGRYFFELESGFEDMDDQHVLGLSVMKDCFQKIGIEFSKHQTDNSVFITQPSSAANHRYFSTPSENMTTTHCFIWSKKQVQFYSARGTIDDHQVFQMWTYELKDNLLPSSERVHMNLWLIDGNGPIDGNDREVIIRNFLFVPMYSPWYMQSWFFIGIICAIILYLAIRFEIISDVFSLIVTSCRKNTMSDAKEQAVDDVI
ncbi:hypothetical protein RCL1_001263 [Eukaryota sp. TZLM3-RCL]